MTRFCRPEHWETSRRCRCYRVHILVSYLREVDLALFNDINSLDRFDDPEMSA